MPPTDPKSVAKNVVLRIILQDRGSNLSALLTASGQDELRRHPDVSFGGLRTETALLTGIEAIPHEAIADIYLSTTAVTQEGDDKGGYRIEFSATGPSNYQTRVFVVQENGQYRAVAAGRNDFAVAREALRLIDKGDVENARRWIDWIGDEQDRYAKSETGTLVKFAFDSVWNTGIRKDRDRMRYAAATALSSSPDDAARIVPILQEGMTKNTGEVQLGIAEALANAFLTLKRYDESAAAGLTVLQSHPHSEVVTVIAESMLELNRRDELLKILKDSVKNSTRTEWVLQVIAAIDVQKGDYADAEKVLIGGGEPGLAFDAAIGWLSQYHSAITDADVARIQKSVEGTRSTYAPGLKTLAALKAETGKPAEALEFLKLGINISGGNIENSDWYIIGRIYEQYGEREAAANAYRKVKPSAKYPLLVNSAYPLAQKRLAAIPR
jgi:tetratricopeptide (TPR) repeat protein